MSELTDSDNAKPTVATSDESVFVKTFRLTINLITHVFICVTVFVSLLFACNASKITAFRLHIILCVLGYQFFMCQGILVISKYNSWSMHLKRRHRKWMHILFQVIGFILIFVGSCVIINVEKKHFNSGHSTLGVLSLITTIISVLNGVAANYAYKLSRAYTVCIKFIHYTSGILSLFLSATALSSGFEEIPFRLWVKNDDALAGLIFINWVFTFFVALDFWLLTGRRLYNLL